MIENREGTAEMTSNKAMLVAESSREKGVGEFELWQSVSDSAGLCVSRKIIDVGCDLES